MRALVYHGTKDVRIDTVPDPVIEEPRDAIVKVTSTAICGSDLHLYDGCIPAMEKGDILGHEFMGEVVEVGSANKKLKVGDRVVVPFNISCGACFFCKKGLWSCCERTNRDAARAIDMFGHNTGGLFGYSHLTGHYPGGQAEYVRVPERLALAELGGAETVNFEKEDVYERLNHITKGRGPDRCIDAVGMEAHGTGSWDAIADRMLELTGLGTDRIHALRECLRNVRAGGTVSLSGVYGGYLNMLPLGAAFQKGVTIRMGQCNVLNYIDKLMWFIQEGRIDPTVVITHRCGLEDGPAMYETFKHKKDRCVKVVMKPHG
jgi:threonine dehydrogenase-like Zn-dependent dehydrogenase